MSYTFSSSNISLVTYNSVSVNWNITPQLTPIQNYLVKTFINTSNTSSNVLNQLSPATNGIINIVGLNPNSNYYASNILLDNGFNIQSISSNSYFRTCNQGIINNITLTSPTNSSVLVRWNSLYYPSGTQVVISTIPSTQNTYSIVDNSNTGVTISGLSASTSYIVNVDVAIISSNVYLSNSGLIVNGLNNSAYIAELIVNNPIYGNYTAFSPEFFDLPEGNIINYGTCNITWGSVQVYWNYSNYPSSCNVTITLSNTNYQSQRPVQVSNIQTLLSNNLVIFSNMSNASNYIAQLTVNDFWYSNTKVTTPVFSNLSHGIINSLLSCNITWGSVQVYWSYSNYPASCNLSITLSNTNYNSYTPSQVSNILNIPLSNKTVTFSNMSNASNYTVTAQVLDQWYSNYTITTPITPLPYGIINSIGTCNITYQSAQIYWTYSNYPGSCNSIINLFNNNTIIQTSNNPLSNNTIIMNNLDWANNYIAQIIVYDQWYSNSILNSIQFTTSNEGFIYDLTTCNINYNSAVLAWSNVNYPPDTQVTLIITSPFGESTASSTSFTIT